MKCPYCGYDKIQPNFNFCPKCKKPLTEQGKQMFSKNPQEKGFLNRTFSRWTYERAMADPYAYAVWAQRNPNDNRVFLGRWNEEGHDLTTIRQTILQVNQARQENPTANNTEIQENVAEANRQRVREESNRSFVDTVNADYTTDAAAIVRNKAIWKLQVGELARHIAPDEWVYVADHLGGIVIEEGTSALIYVDGVQVAEMGSGMYVFDDKRSEAEAEVNKRKPESRGFFGRIADSIYRFVTGHKREESTQQREERRRRIEQVVGRLKKDTIIDVYLKSDRVFPAVFGQQHLSDSPEGYMPYIVQSRNLDVQVGVSMQMQIGDFKDFLTNYMVGKKSVSIADVVKSADGSVFSILRYRLRDIEITERGLDEHTYNAIKEHLKQNLPNVLKGVIVVDVLDIATTNEQLARFRKVEEQLYCSEREYDFLLRTNEFRNRIASEENDQKIREAHSEQELRFRLDDVNKDNLLHADEMEQFVSLLMNQKVIREATNKSDLDKAMLEIQRNSLIAQDEFDSFSNDLENKRFDRDQISEQLRARSLMATALQKLEADKTLAIAEIHQTDEITDAEWDATRKQKGREAESWDMEAAIYGRRYVLEKQQLLDSIENKRIQGAYDIEEAGKENKLEEVRIQGDRVRADYGDERKLKEHEIDEKIKEDEYQREVRQREDELRQLQQRTDIDLSALERKARLAQENLRATKEMELNELKEKHAHEQSMASMDADVKKKQIEAESNMTAEQLLGLNISSMDAAAQVQFAESFSHLKEVELTKASADKQAELYQQMIGMAQANGVNMQNLLTTNSQQQLLMMQQLMATFAEITKSQAGGQQNLTNTMLNAIQGVANGKIQDIQSQKEEYRTQMQHEQERMDETQKQALNYTSRVAVSENTPNIMGGTSIHVNVGTLTCPRCGEPIDDKEANCCPVCGENLK